MPDDDDRLDPPPQRILEMGNAAIRAVAEYYSALRDLPIRPSVTGRELRERLAADLPVEGAPFEELVSYLREELIPATRHNGHPRFFGYIASPGSAATALADLLASALNPNVTSWRSAPGPTELERGTIRWITEIVGYPQDAGGLFVSGGSMANLCGLAAARDALSSQPVTETGCRGLDRDLRVYVSEEAHFSIAKAAGLLGIGRRNVCPVPTNASLQMDTAALEARIDADLAAGALPICVVGSAGTVETGAIDDLQRLAAVAERHRLWFHVDASYGGFAMLAPSRRSLFEGIARADSIALDPHKWLYVPVDCGCILYREPDRARAPFAHNAEYTRVLGHDADEEFAFWDYGPELSRRFRALKVWMMLAHVGTRRLGQAIERNCRCAAHVASLVDASDDLEMLAPVSLSIFCFRYIPRDRRLSEEELDTLNRRILDLLQRGGSSYLSNARIGGRFALRGCVLNYRTTEEDMRVLLEDVRACAAQALHGGDTGA